jgi:predicted DNA-binding transcriptional regulator YafY
LVRVNRTDRLYALIKELRAVAPRPRSARWLASRFEVSVRTVERDINALQQSGMPIYAEPGRTGGYRLDKARTLPPVNLTPGEAVAMAVALRRLEGTPFRATAGSALRMLVAAMQGDAAVAARDLAGRIHLLGDAGTAGPAPSASAHPVLDLVPTTARLAAGKNGAGTGDGAPRLHHRHPPPQRRPGPHPVPAAVPTR